ncbi:MAG: hypothetical protein AB9861_05930 [Methanosarcina sp.]|jgi:hypothetical protein
MIAKKFGIGILFLAMFLVSTAFVPAVTAEEVANVAENTKDRDIVIRAPIQYISISGDLSQPSNTDTYTFTVPSGQGWDRVTADVLVSNIHTLDTSGDISIELIKPNGTKVAGDTIYGTETHLDFDYSPGYDLTAGTWKIRVKGVDLNGTPGYDGSATVYN